MRFFAILASLSIISACGEKYTPLYVDQELAPFVDMFISASEIRSQPMKLSNLIIKLGDANEIKPEQSKVGYCLTGRANTSLVLPMDDYENANIVVIDKNFWNNPQTTDVMRRNLIFHELGHCVLLLQHDTRTWGGNPVSIMFPNLISPSVYSANESRYLDQLFGLIDRAFIGQSETNQMLYMTTDDMSCGTEEL